MRFTCDNDLLAQTVSLAARAATTGAPTGASCLRLLLSGDDLTVTAANPDMTLSATVQVNGSDDGQALIPARLFTTVVKSLAAGAATVESQDDSVDVSCCGAAFSLVGLKPDEATMPGPGHLDDGDNSFGLDGVAADLARVLPAASADEDRVVLTGVQVGIDDAPKHLAATDGFRLAISGVSAIGAHKRHIVLPARAVKELLRIVEDDSAVVMTTNDATATFAIGSTRLSVRLIAGEYPRYESLISDKAATTRLECGRDDLIEAVKRVRLIESDSRSKRITLSVAGTVLTVASANAEVGAATETLDAGTTGEDISVDFNSTYLLDGLSALAGERACFEITEPRKPVRLTDAGSDFLYLLMPIGTS